MGKIARGLLLIGAVGLAAFLIMRALRAKLPEPEPVTPPITITPIVDTIAPIPPPEPIVTPIDGFVPLPDGGGDIFILGAGETAIPQTAVAGLETELVGPEPGLPTGDVTQPPTTAQTITEPSFVPVLPTFEPRIETVGTGFLARPVFML